MPFRSRFYSFRVEGINHGTKNTTGELRVERAFSSKKNFVKFIAGFICALITVRSVNLMEIAQAMEGKAKQESNYKKIQRYFRSLLIPESSWADFLLSCYPQHRFVLSLDRTNWQIGRIKINFLVLAVVFKHASIPIYWMLLPKKGNSNSQERIAMVNKFIRYQGAEKIAYLTADREFGSQSFIKHLGQQNIRFCFRIKNNSLIQEPGQEVGLPVRNYLKQIPFKHNRVIENVSIWGFTVSIVMFRKKKDSVVLITNFDAKRAAKHYRQRWKIEELFQNLKSRGFNLETTRLTDLKRLHLLMGLLTLVYVWCYLIGEESHYQKPIPKKKHGRLAKSVFRLGLDQLRFALFKFDINQQILILLIDKLKKRLVNPCPVLKESQPIVITA